MRSISVAGEGLSCVPLTRFSKSQSGLRKTTSPAGRGKLYHALAGAIYICLCSPSAHAGVLSDAPPSPLEMQIIGDAPTADKIAVGLRLINHADHAITIQRGIEIDQGGGFKWAALMMIQAVADCGAYDQNHEWRASVRIAAGAEMDIAPWHGRMCGSQCPEGCAKNTSFGPGSYRFVVITAEGERLPSPSFTVPAQ